MATSNDDMEYLPGPTIIKSVSYTFPPQPIITQDFKFEFARDKDGIWVKGLVPVEKENDDFTLSGAL